MITVKIMGGLGNQMFQYALARKLQILGKKVKVDIDYYKKIPKGDTNRGIGIYNFHHSFIESGMLENLTNIIGKLYAKLRGAEYVIVEKTPDFIPSILNVESGYLVGYWQTEKYFSDIASILKKDFEFDLKIVNEKERQIYDRIKLTPSSVSVHIRRGDYLNPENHIRFGNICTTDYYEKAMTYIKNKVPECKFFIFTDAPQEAEEFLPKNFEYEILSSGSGNEWTELFLMSQCTHNIIANSSFSWWGAWLNPNPDKIVAAPPRWTNTNECTDIYCDGWVKII